MACPAVQAPSVVALRPTTGEGGREYLRAARVGLPDRLLLSRSSSRAALCSSRGVRGQAGCVGGIGVVYPRAARERLWDRARHSPSSSRGDPGWSRAPGGVASRPCRGCRGRRRSGAGAMIFSGWVWGRSARARRACRQSPSVARNFWRAASSSGREKSSARRRATAW